MGATATDERDALELPVRRGRTALVAVVTAAATVLLAWAWTQPNSGLTSADWYVTIFPLLALISGYRLVRPKVPLRFDEQGVKVWTGLPGLALRTRIAWSDVAQLRVTASDVLLVELRDPDRWMADKPWLVRANVSANRRRHGAAVAVAVRELRPPDEGLAPALRRVAPVPVKA